MMCRSQQGLPHPISPREEFPRGRGVEQIELNLTNSERRPLQALLIGPSRHARQQKEVELSAWQCARPRSCAGTSAERASRAYGPGRLDDTTPPTADYGRLRLLAALYGWSCPNTLRHAYPAPPAATMPSRSPPARLVVGGPVR